MATAVITAPDGRKATLTIPDGAPPELIQQKANEAKAALARTAVPAQPQSALGTVGDVLNQRLIQPTLGAASRTLGISDLGTIFGGSPEEKQALMERQQRETTLAGQPRAMLRRGADVATLASPVVAPGALAAGVGTEAGLRLAGVDPSVASGVGDVMEFAQPFGGVVAKGTVKSIDKGVEALSRRGRKIAGPSMKAIKDPVSGMYTRIRSAADQGGLALDPASPTHAALGAQLDDMWQSLEGMHVGGRQAKIVEDVMNAVESKVPIPYSRLDDLRLFLNETLPAAGKVGFDEKLLTRRMDALRGSLKGAQKEVLSGSPILSKSLDVADARWAKEVAPARKVLSSLRPKDDVTIPAKVAHAIGGTTDDVKQLMKHDPNANFVIKNMTRYAKAQKFGAQTPMVVGLAGGVLGAGTNAAFQFQSGKDVDAKTVLVPLGIIAAGAPAGKLIHLIAKGMMTPAGSKAGARLSTLIGREAERLGYTGDQEPQPEPTRMASTPTTVPTTSTTSTTQPEPRAAIPPSGEWAKMPLAERQAALRGAYGEPKAQHASLMETPRETSNPSPAPTDMFDRAGQIVGLDPNFLRAVMTAESSGNPKAVSGKNAHGLMQIIPATWRGLAPKVEAITGRKASLHNSEDNVLAGAIYYRGLLEQTGGDVVEAAKLYHGGPDPRNHGPLGRDYARKVARYYAAAGGQ